MPETKFEFPKPPPLPFSKETGSTVNAEDWLPAPPPDLPLPKFIVKQMRKQ